MSVLVSSWLVATPVLWAHRWEQAVVAAVVGLLGFILAPAVVASPRLRPSLALLGAALVLATFIFPDRLLTTADNLVVGFLHIIAGYSPEVVVTAAAAQRTEPAIEVEVVRPRAAA